MIQRIADSFSGEIKSTCTTIFAGFDYNTQESIVIPDEIRQAIEKYER
jgi:acyl-CoA thioesterase FadM